MTETYPRPPRPAIIATIEAAVSEEYMILPDKQGQGFRVIFRALGDDLTNPLHLDIGYAAPDVADLAALCDSVVEAGGIRATGELDISRTDHQARGLLECYHPFEADKIEPWMTTWAK